MCLVAYPTTSHHFPIVGICVYIYIHTVHNTQCLCCTSTFSLWTDSHNSVENPASLQIAKFSASRSWDPWCNFDTWLAESQNDAKGPSLTWFFNMYNIYIHIPCFNMFQPWEWEIPSTDIYCIKVSENHQPGEFSSHFWWSQWPPGSPKKSVACRLLLRSSNLWRTNLLAVFSEIDILRFQSRLFPETSGNLSYTYRKYNMQTA